MDRVDPRFVWNESLLAPLLLAAPAHPAVHGFVVPLIHGAVFINKCMINGKGFTWSLVSRRSRRRVGARLFVRGCDERGNVANFVETEQVVEHGGAVASFVQTRGSMPMFWQQAPNLALQARPQDGGGRRQRGRLPGALQGADVASTASRSSST